jgi:hypothetical protein
MALKPESSYRIESRKELERGILLCAKRPLENIGKRINNKPSDLIFRRNASIEVHLSILDVESQ